MVEHGRVTSKARAGPGGTARDEVHCAQIGQGPRNLLIVWTTFLFAAAAGVQNHGRLNSGRVAVMAIHQKGTLIIVTVSTEDEVRSIRLQDGKDIFSHLDQFQFEV